MSVPRHDHELPAPAIADAASNGGRACRVAQLNRPVRQAIDRPLHHDIDDQPLRVAAQIDQPRSDPVAYEGARTIAADEIAATCVALGAGCPVAGHDRHGVRCVVDGCNLDILLNLDSGTAKQCGPQGIL
jgi:hypothetical protein